MLPLVVGGPLKSLATNFPSQKPGIIGSKVIYKRVPRCLTFDVWTLWSFLKNSKFLCGHRKGHSPIVFVYMHLVIRGHILCLDQLHSCIVIMLSDLYFTVWRFSVTNTHTLLSLVCCTT